MENIGYVTLQESNDYVSSHFLSSDEKRINWETLDEKDKTVLLNQSLSDIENLNFIGYRTETEQELSWPRNGCNTVPLSVKMAQIEGAVARLTSDTSYESMANGIKSESLGSASYSYTTETNVSIKSGIRPESYKLLKKYIKQVFKFL